MERQERVSASPSIGLSLLLPREDLEEACFQLSYLIKGTAADEADEASNNDKEVSDGRRSLGHHKETEDDPQVYG